MYELFGLILIIIYIIVDYFFAKSMQEIVKEKGYTKSYFTWCFVLPLHGFMLVNSLPDRKGIDINSNSSLQTKSIQDDLPDL